MDVRKKKWIPMINGVPVPESKYRYDGPVGHPNTLQVYNANEVCGTVLMDFTKQRHQHYVSLARTLVGLLRHNTVRNGIPQSPDGYIKLSDIKKGSRKLRKLQPQDVYEVVERADDPLRFQLKGVPGCPPHLIRATQHHTSGSRVVKEAAAEAKWKANSEWDPKRVLGTTGGTAAFGEEQKA